MEEVVYTHIYCIYIYDLYKHFPNSTQSEKLESWEIMGKTSSNYHPGNTIRHLFRGPLYSVIHHGPRGHKKKDLMPYNDYMQRNYPLVI